MTIDGGTLTVEPARRIDDDVEFYDVPVELAVLDIAGTTLRDTWLVEGAFTRASEHIGLVQSDDDQERMLTFVRETMGQSAIEVFRSLAHNEFAAQRAVSIFESAYRERLSSVVPVDGAEQTFELLREAGVSVVLTSGFSRGTLDALIDELAWRDLVDATLCPADAGRGSPSPDLPLTALVRTEAQSVDSMVVVGDTVSDMRAGIAAGAGLVGGVLTGVHSAEQLHRAGADEVLTSIAVLPAMLGVSAEL
ncbi:HAD family hydrolase [Paramicrobacterium agarici]|uniref:Phosphonatase-like hydrolase n=1 Tax=Paramicrobacterium agarici TaxID=630514 RepID=A0A2A9DUK2_9MICO|nr:HAD family hydrolase [Microbacterium agarici]PFG30368.1 phosphonatase-like hydrolase [Microbacterium agarici]